MHLKQDIVDRLTLPPGKSEIRVFDTSRNAPTGFGVRVAGVRRTYILQYRENGASRSRVLANANDVTLEEARALAKAYNAQRLINGDPNAAKAAAVAAAKVVKMEAAKNLITLGATYETFLSHLEKHDRSPKHVTDTRRYLKVAWKPLHALRVDAVERKNVAAQLAKITAASGAISGNRARVALSSYFKWAVGEGLADANPVAGTNRPAAESSRDHFLTDEDLCAVWAACGEDDYGRIVRLLALTACRREEVGAMAWSELHLERRMWIIPGARTKNGLSQEVPLTDAMLAILNAVPRRENRDLLFGLGEAGYGGWSKSKKALDERVAKAREEAGLAPIAAWRLHDLRRTVATRMADELAVQPHVVEAVLNHISGHRSGVARIYNRATYRREKTVVLTLWSDRVVALTTKHPAKVSPLRAVAR
ncbi:site-specific integrase [Enterovirga sp.]|uniref:tyrosine-type recombinase/integrase n=1 Tax=Enterovirga sp. TaxID=2026350 RepID=UPI002C311C2E|nr:site-specific integrase [Enterovirga sp.]HMO30398.1 site-specific integrase [Enterovirga sp.]